MGWGGRVTCMPRLVWPWDPFPRHHRCLSFSQIPQGGGVLWGGCKPWKAGSPRSEQNGPLSSGNSSSSSLEALSSSSEVQRSATGCLSRSRSSGRASVTSFLQGRKNRGYHPGGHAWVWRLGGCTDTSHSNHSRRGGVLELEDRPVVGPTS